MKWGFIGRINEEREFHQNSRAEMVAWPGFSEARTGRLFILDQRIFHQENLDNNPNFLSLF